MWGEFRTLLLQGAYVCAKKSKYVITWRTSEDEDIKTPRNDVAVCISLPSSRGWISRSPSLSLKMNPSEAVTATSMYGIICWRVGGLDTCMETQMLRSVACPGSILIYVYRDDADDGS